LEDDVDGVRVNPQNIPEAYKKFVGLNILIRVRNMINHHHRLDNACDDARMKRVTLSLFFTQRKFTIYCIESQGIVSLSYFITFTLIFLI
jgi:hypothetical protein